ncbi:hypothetical protein CW306_03390 [Bacillus sp. BA3]|nr:hypothetical protein CW306_03390 [Bacillus sp. BA3]
MTVSNPKKQHFVPQVYLNYFADEASYFNIFDKSLDKIWRQTPANAGYSTHFYTVEIEGEKDFFIEKLLAESVDSLYSRLIKKIEEKEPLTKNDKIDLSTFIAYQHLRTPAQRKNYNNMVISSHKKINKLVFSMKKNKGQLEDYTVSEIESLSDTFINGKYDVDVPKERSLGFMLDFSKEMTTMLSNHNFIILEASKRAEFITSDNPYCMVKEKWSENWSGFGVINTTKFFPLTPKYLLVLKDPGNKFEYMKVNKSDVRSLNRLIFSWADRFIFSRNSTLLDSLIDVHRKK